MFVFPQTGSGRVRDRPVREQDGRDGSDVGAHQGGTKGDEQTTPGGAEEGKGGRVLTNMVCVGS